MNYILNVLFIFSTFTIGIKKSREVSSQVLSVENAFKINIYIRKKSASKRVIIYYHGGGWFFGDLRIFDRILRYLSYKSDCVVVGVEYRKAPKYKFPIQIHDSVKAYKWVVKNIHKYNGDKENIILVGDSAGGNLAITVNNQIRKLNIAKPKAMVLFYPLLDISIEAVNEIKMESKGPINFAGYYVLKYIALNYLVNSNQRNSPLVSINKNLEKCQLPETFLVQASSDPLNNQIEIFYKHMINNNQSLTRKKYNFTMHGFLNLGGIIKNAYLALDDSAEFIKNIKN